MNDKTRMITLVKDYAMIALGCLITALSFNLFFVPHQIAPGGLSGIGTVLYHVFGFPVGVTTLALNIPLFLFGVKQIGREFGAKTLVATLLLSFFIDFVQVPPLTDDSLLASIYGGVLMGIGLGIIFRRDATTGGTDLMAKLIHRYFPIISMAWVMFAVDFMVVVTAAIVFGPNEALYAIVALALSARVIDLVQEGLNTAKAALIISDKSKDIADRILHDMDRGVTLLQGKGAYTGNDKNVILCVVNRTEITHLKELINEIDRKAFVLVADVREVLGEGF
ncbi:MAG TPA: YitT family protein [Candidatus Atribacteria bacterium]|nr:YitT family protein [Candidatus Atribacteria bacterium]